MTSSLERRPCWCLVDWAFLRPQHVREDQRRFAALIERAYDLAPPSRVLFVLREQDRPWWARALASHPKANVIEQPFDRGSATAVLVGALHIHQLEPEARVWLLGRGSGRVGVPELLDTYRRKTPDLYRTSVAFVQRGRDSRSALDQVYPFLACLELEAVLGA